MSTILGLVITAAVFYGLYRAVRASFEAYRGRVAASPEELEHRRQRKDAEKTVKRAEKGHAAAVRTAEKQLRAARKSHRVATLGALQLFDDQIKTPEGTHQLTSSTVAQVEAAGGVANKSRTTLTRVAVGTALAPGVGTLVGAVAKKNKKIDDRELYITVQDAAWSSVVKIDPDKGLAARQFAQKVMATAQGAEQARQSRARAISDAQHRLDAVHGDDRAVRQAREHLTAIAG